MCPGSLAIRSDSYPISSGSHDFSENVVSSTDARFFFLNHNFILPLTYNEQRLHESLGYRCPVDYYRQTSLKLAIRKREGRISFFIKKCILTTSAWQLLILVPVETFWKLLMIAMTENPSQSLPNYLWQNGMLYLKMLQLLMPYWTEWLTMLTESSLKVQV